MSNGDKTNGVNETKKHFYWNIVPTESEFYFTGEYAADFHTFYKY